MDYTYIREVFAVLQDLLEGRLHDHAAGRSVIPPSPGALDAAAGGAQAPGGQCGSMP